MAYTKIEEWVTIAKQIANENGGKVPCYRVLRERGLLSLYYAMRRDRQAFKDIEVERPRRGGTPATFYATKLLQVLEERDHVLPRGVDLDRIQPGLRTFVANNKHLVDGVRVAKLTDKQQARLQEAVKQAETIAKANGGFLRNDSEFQAKNSQLKTFIYDHPEAFSHIPVQKRVNELKKKHVAAAEQLAKDYGGALPSRIVIDAVAGCALFEYIRKHPEAFAHIPRARGKCSMQDYVLQAHALTSLNGGVLPGCAWLQRHGFKSLVNAMCGSKESFREFSRSEAA